MKGRLRDFGYSRDGESLLTISTREDIGTLFDELHDADVEVTVKKHNPKRGLSQNALYWSSLTDLARHLRVSNNYLHNRMIRDYGQPEYYGDKVAYIMLPDTDETEEKALEAETYHIKPTSHVKHGTDGVSYRAYMLMRGSSTYNREEFSRLLDGLLEECKKEQVPIRTGRGD